MALGCTPHLLMTLFGVVVPAALAADECTSPSASAVHLSASSFRNTTGHWIAEASLTRKSSRCSSDVRSEERPWQYDVGIIRQGCNDVETLTTTFSVVAPPARVSADYTFFPNVGFYKLHNEAMSWEDARRTCAREGAHLAIVNSAAEEKAIVELMKPYREQKEDFRASIGFHDKFKEGQYVTVLGQPLSSTGYVKWAKGEPSNKDYFDSPEEDCGDVFADGSLNDVKCSVEQAFICEQSL